MPEERDTRIVGAAGSRALFVLLIVHLLVVVSGGRRLLVLELLPVVFSGGGEGGRGACTLADEDEHAVDFDAFDGDAAKCSQAEEVRHTVRIHDCGNTRW